MLFQYIACMCMCVQAPSYFVGTAGSTLGLGLPVLILPPVGVDAELLGLLLEGHCHPGPGVKHPGVEEGAVHPIPPVPVPSQPPVLQVLFVGRVDGEKCLGLLLKTVHSLNQDSAGPHPIAHLHVAGSGKQLPALREYAARLGLLCPPSPSSRGCVPGVSFLGHLDRRQLLGLLLGPGVFIGMLHTSIYT